MTIIILQIKPYLKPIYLWYLFAAYKTRLHIFYNVTTIYTKDTKTYLSYTLLRTRFLMF